MSSSSVVEEFSRPSPKDGYYDVFISFRGADTRSGFTDTLYRTLLENEVYTFIDADLAGNVIETLFKIIGRSRMAVVVYSESFASSHWCLRELETIMQRWENKKMLMIPIFYKVDAHELKHPTEKITKYFDEHITKYGEPIVGKWKDAITKIGNVSGFPYKDVYTRSERDFIITQVIVIIKKKLREWETSLDSCTSNPYISDHAVTKNHHDVFISFLGKDTRYDLVSHLYKALMNYRKDIKIFMEDRDLLKDDSILEVIQQSKMSVVVFSKNYASSKWCLRELVKILQCSNTTGQELLPIFYEQADNEKIAYYLEKHERDEKLETVQSWRNAITDLDYKVGWRYSTANSKTGELAYLIKSVVEEISTILNRLDEKKESTMNQQEKMSAKEENTQAVFAVQTYVGVGNSRSEVVTEIEEEEIRGEVALKMVEQFELEEEEEELSSDDEQQQPYDQLFTHTNTTTNGEEKVYLNINPPNSLRIYVPLSCKDSSSCLGLTNTTHNNVAFKIQFTTDQALKKYRICPSEGLLLPFSKCQVIVTMEAQSIRPTDMKCTDKFFVQSVITEKDSYSMGDFSDMFTEESETAIHKHEMSVVYFTSLQGASSFHQVKNVHPSSCLKTTLFCLISLGSVLLYEFGRIYFIGTILLFILLYVTVL